MSSFVVNVIRVEQRYEDVDVQQGDSCHSSSRSLFTSAMVGRRLPFGRRGKSGTPLRTRGGRFGSSDFRARSEITRPAVVARLEAISLAACRMSSSISRVVLTGKSSRITHLMSTRELGGDELQVGEEKTVEALLAGPVFRPEDG